MKTLRPRETGRLLILNHPAKWELAGSQERWWGEWLAGREAVSARCSKLGSWYLRYSRSFCWQRESFIIFGHVILGKRDRHTFICTHFTDRICSYTKCTETDVFKRVHSPPKDSFPDFFPRQRFFWLLFFCVSKITLCSHIECEHKVVN